MWASNRREDYHMPACIRWILFSSSAAWILMAPTLSVAQAPYYGAVRMARGQDVTPAFEGWMANLDGTFTLYFGYMNRNYEEELDIPVGADNNIEPGGDRGQPTHFYSRRQRLVFSMVVPKDWGPERKVVWTLNIRGRTNVAKRVAAAGMGNRQRGDYAECGGRCRPAE
jgi:hypothetical protein